MQSVESQEASAHLLQRVAGERRRSDCRAQTVFIVLFVESVILSLDCASPDEDLDSSLLDNRCENGIAITDESTYNHNVDQDDQKNLERLMQCGLLSYHYS